MHRRVVPLVAIMALIAIAAPAGVAGSGDRPNTCAAAATSSPRNRWLTETLSSSTDVDWFRFNLESSAGVIVTLGDLPANYRISLWSSCSTRLAAADVSGIQFEEIVRNLPVGAYRVRVSSKVGASGPGAYHLRFRTLSTGVQMVSAGQPYVDSTGWLHFPGEIWNNTSSNRKYIRITLKLYDAADVLLDIQNTWTMGGVIKAGARDPFDVQTHAPPGFDHYRVYVNGSSTTATEAPAGLTVDPGVPWYDGIGYRHDVGTVKNAATTTAQWVRVNAALFDARGGVIKTAFTFTEPNHLLAGEVGTYEIWTDATTETVNRVRLYVTCVR